MIPVYYLIALIITLIAILHNIYNVFYSTSKNIKRNILVSFFLPPIWIYAFFGFNSTFIILLGIICGILGVILYILYSSNVNDNKEEKNETVDVKQYIGLTGQVCYVMPEKNKYIGCIIDGSDNVHDILHEFVLINERQIQFTCEEPLEKYDFFRITNFEDNQFKGEKINNL